MVKLITIRAKHCIIIIDWHSPVITSQTYQHLELIQLPLRKNSHNIDQSLLTNKHPTSTGVRQWNRSPGKADNLPYDLLYEYKSRENMNINGFLQMTILVIIWLFSVRPRTRTTTLVSVRPMASSISASIRAIAAASTASASAQQVMRQTGYILTSYNQSWF